MFKVFDTLCGCSGAALTVLLVGCTPGELTWDGGRDVLRTAIYKEVTSGDDHIATLLLSNSQFPCGLPETDDPSERTEDITELLAAACREDARHVNIRLYRQGGRGWTGSYTGADDASVAGLTSAQPRLASAAYYAVEEAFLVDLGDIDRAYAVSSELLDLKVAGGGEVEIARDGDRLVGSFAFPQSSLQGSFRATICEGDTTVLDLLEPSPSHICP